VVVQPPDAILLGQMRLGRMLGQQLVEAAGRGVDIAPGQAGEHGVQAPGESHQLGNMGGLDAGHRGRVDGEDAFQRRHDGAIGWHRIGRGDDQLIDQVHRNQDAGVSITV